MAAPGMVSFLAFLSKPQTSGGPKWGRVAWRKTSGHWPCPSSYLTVDFTLPSPVSQDWLSSRLEPILSADSPGLGDAGTQTHVIGHTPLTVEVF